MTYGELFIGIIIYIVILIIIAEILYRRNKNKVISFNLLSDPSEKKYNRNDAYMTNNTICFITVLITLVTYNIIINWNTII